MNDGDRFLVKLDLARPITGSQARVIQQFATRKDAEAGARAIGWLPSDATTIEIMGFRLWCLTDPHQQALTRDGFTALSRDRAG